MTKEICAAPIKLKDIHVEIASSLYRAGASNDGEEYIAECFFIVAEGTKGRWIHPTSFAGCNVISNENGIYFEDVREQARAAAEKLRFSLMSRSDATIAGWMNDDTFMVEHFDNDNPPLTPQL